jgi:outer membrane protein TolC
MRRTRIPRRSLLLVSAAVLAVAPAGAETLEDAWAQALQNDHRVAAAALDVDGARAAERAAAAARWPVLGATASLDHFASPPQLALSSGGFALNSPLFAGNSMTSAGLQLQVPLYTGGRIGKGIAAARETTRGAADAERIERSALRLDVARAYVGVLRARHALANATSSAASLAAHAADVDGMVERELVPRSDLLAARVAFANAEQQRLHAQNAAALAIAAFNRRLGQPLDREPELSEELTTDAVLAAMPLDQLVTRALETRAELAALASQARALDLQAAAARGAMLPQLALTGSRSYLENEILDRRNLSMVSVGVTWKLFDGGEARNRSSALRSAGRAAGSRLDDLRSQIELEVREAWLGEREARARVSAAGESVAQSEENLRISRELYGSGLGTNTQVLEAVALQVGAANNEHNARLDVSLARLTLAHAVGSL